MKNAENANLVAAPALAARFRAYWNARQAVSTALGARHWCRARAA